MDDPHVGFVEDKGEQFGFGNFADFAPPPPPPPPPPPDLTDLGAPPPPPPPPFDSAEECANDYEGAAAKEEEQDNDRRVAAAATGDVMSKEREEDRVSDEEAAAPSPIASEEERDDDHGNDNNIVDSNGSGRDVRDESSDNENDNAEDDAEDAHVHATTEAHQQVSEEQLLQPSQSQSQSASTAQSNSGDDPHTPPLSPKSRGIIRTRDGSVRGTLGSVKRLTQKLPALMDEQASNSPVRLQRHVSGDVIADDGTVVARRGSVDSTVKNLVRLTRPKTLAEKLEEAERAAGDATGGKIVIYTSSMRAVHATAAACQEMRKIFQRHRVMFEDRDVMMSSEFNEQLRQRCSGAGVPQAFLNGKHFGDLAKISELNDTGALGPLLGRMPKIPDTLSGECGQCGGRGFYPCTWCGGDKKSMMSRLGTELIKLRCTCCNENGLMRCTACV